jgi:hypothetical protein
MSTRRKKGRPIFNRRFLRRERIESLPDRFNLSKGALRLHVAPETLRRWVAEGCPCLRIQSDVKNTSYSFEREKVIAWLIQTNRYHGKP